MKTYFQVVYRTVEGLGTRWFVREYGFQPDGSGYIEVAMHGPTNGYETIGSASSLATHMTNKRMGIY